MGTSDGNLNEPRFTVKFDHKIAIWVTRLACFWLYPDIKVRKKKIPLSFFGVCNVEPAGKQEFEEGKI